VAVGWFAGEEYSLLYPGRLAGWIVHGGHIS
jgi:hypothetical protein